MRCQGDKKTGNINLLLYYSKMNLAAAAVEYKHVMKINKNGFCSPLLRLMARKGRL
jgi:hypothetical protein